MTMRRQFVFMLFLACFMAARSIVIDCRPGELKQRVGADYASQTELTLTGTADASDLFFISDNMRQLTSLDMSQLEIVAYSGASLRGNTHYAAAYIPAGTFADTRLKELVLPDGLHIGAMAFAQTRLVAVVLPKGTRRIDIGAFAGSNLKTATLAADATYESAVFSSCIFLESVDLGGMKKLPPSFFKNCQSLCEVEGFAGLVEIGDEAFSYCVRLENITSGPGLEKIGEKAFYYSGLTAADLSGSSIDSINRHVFMDCFDMNSLLLPQSCTLLGDYALANSGMSSALRLGGIAEIGRYSLASCNLLASLVLPGSLVYVGDGAMQNLRSLTNIYAGELAVVPMLGEDVFGALDRSTVNLYAAEDVVNSFREAEVWQDFNILTQTKDGVESPSVDIATLRGRIVGHTLELVATSADIGSLEVYNASGMLLLSCAPAASTCAVDLAAIPTGAVILVAAILSDGSKHSLKFAI